MFETSVNIDVIFKIASMGVMLLQGLFMWILWSLRHEFVRQQDFEQNMTELASQSGAYKSRLQTVEFKVDALPKTEALHEIMLSLQEVKGEQKALSERISSLHEILKRIEHPLGVLTQQHIMAERK